METNTTSRHISFHSESIAKTLSNPCQCSTNLVILYSQNSERADGNWQQVQQDVFVSGLCQYQYNQWYKPFQSQITFNPMTGPLSSFGEDNIGQYVLGGSLSEINKNIQMI